MVKYRHPVSVMKGNGLRGSQSTPALAGVKHLTADAAASTASAGAGGSTTSSLRLPPVEAPPQGASLPAGARKTRGATVTGQPKTDAQVIADALAHGTSYSELDTSDLGRLAAFERAYNAEDETQHLQDTLASREPQAAVTDGDPDDDLPEDPAVARQKHLKKMVKYWAGAEPDVKSDAERKKMHEENVAALLAATRDKTKRRLQAPKWVKDRQALAEVEEQVAMGLRASPRVGTTKSTSLGGDGATVSSSNKNNQNDTDEDSQRTAVEASRRRKAWRNAGRDTTYAGWVKDRQDFQNVFHRFAYKPRDLTAVALIAAKKHPEERLPDDTAIMAQWVSANFPQLTKDTKGDDECLELIINKIRVRDAKAGEQIYKIGEDANVFYLVMRGSVRLDFTMHNVDGADSTKILSRTISRAQGFGEEALTVGALRPVTATALEDGTVLGTVRGFSFRETTHTYMQGLNLRAKRFLTESVPLLAGWSTNRLLALAETAQRGRYLTGEHLGKQGADIPGLAFVVTGKASIYKEVSYTKANRWPTSQAGDYKEVTRETQVKVKTFDLGQGDYFGEEILLGFDRWQGTVIADEPVEVLIIPRGEALFTMFRRVAQKVLVHSQREHMQSQNLVAAKHLGDIQNRKNLDRQKLLCYGVKHRFRLEEAGQKETNETTQKRWEKRHRKFLKKQLEMGIFESSGCLQASLSSPTLGRREPSPDAKEKALREKKRRARSRREETSPRSPVEPRVRR